MSPEEHNEQSSLDGNQSLPLATQKDGRAIDSFHRCGSCYPEFNDDDINTFIYIRT